MYYTYVLQSKKDGRWYTGVTEDLRKRLIEHNDGQSQSTKGRGPFEIMYYEACVDGSDAFAREKYLKSGQGKRYLKNRLQRFLSLTEQVEGVYPVRNQTPMASADAKRHQISNGGYVALISAIVISVLLITLTATLSFSSFFGRFNVLYSEFKERSVGLAEACADTALLKLAAGEAIATTLVVPLGTDVCTIFPVTSVAGQTTVKTQAQFQGAWTNLVIVVNNADTSVVSWTEVP